MTKLIHQISPTKTEEFSIARIQSDIPDQQWEVYFLVDTKIGDEVVSTQFNPELFRVVATPEIVSLWQQLEALILEAKRSQLDYPEETTLAPDYKGFSDALLSGNNGQPSQIFLAVQTAAADSTVAGLHYGNFSWQLGQAINGLPNVPAFQACLNNMISVLPPDTDLTELTTLFETHRIPLEIPNA